VWLFGSRVVAAVADQESRGDHLAPQCRDISPERRTGCRSRLASRAEVSAAPGETDALDGRSANVAGLISAAEDLHFEMMPALAAAGVKVIPEAGAAVAEGEFEGFADAGVEARDTRLRERIGGAFRADAADEERLVRVDITDAGDGRLIEQRRLHRGRTALEESVEIGRRELLAQRFRAEL